MNARLYNRVLEIARALKPSFQTGQQFHVSALLRKGRIVCVATNNYNKRHLEHRFGRYVNTRFSNSGTEYRPSLHSECAVAIRAGLEDWSGLSLLNVRINNNGEAALSKCCPNCARVVAGLGPNHVFYSVDNQEFAEQTLESS